MFSDGIQLLDKWSPFLNDEMITQNVLALPLSLSRIKKSTSTDLHGFYIYIYSYIYTHAYLLSHFSHVWLLQPYGLLPTRLLCPWDSPGKNTGVGCHVLLQGIFPTQGPYSHLLQLLHCRQFLYCWATRKVHVCVCVCTDILYCFIFLCTWTSYWRKYP